MLVIDGIVAFRPSIVCNNKTIDCGNWLSDVHLAWNYNDEIKLFGFFFLLAIKCISWVLAIKINGREF